MLPRASKDEKQDLFPTDSTILVLEMFPQISFSRLSETQRGRGAMKYCSERVASLLAFWTQIKLSLDKTPLLLCIYLVFQANL